MRKKITNPGNKTIYRIYSRDSHKIIADLICLVGETYDENNSLLLFDPVATWKKTLLAPGTYTMKEIMVPIFKDGVCVYHSPQGHGDPGILQKESWIPCGMRQSVW